MSILNSISLSDKILVGVITVLTFLGGASCSYWVFRTGTDYELRDHERRITSLEAIGVDRTAQEVSEHSRAIESLAQAVAKDHDSIVKILAELERNINHQ